MPNKLDVAMVVDWILHCQCKESLKTILVAARTQQNVLEHRDQDKPKTTPLGVDVAANPGTERTS